MRNPFYGPQVMMRFQQPRHVGSLDVDDPCVGSAEVGSLAMGDLLKLQVRVKDTKIEQACFRAYGDPAMIAAGSWLAEWLIGRTLDEACEPLNQRVTEALALPPLRMHCALLAEDAAHAAVADYRRKQAA